MSNKIKNTTFGNSRLEYNLSELLHHLSSKYDKQIYTNDL